MPTIAGLGHDVRSQKHNPGFAQESQGLRYLSHHWLLSRIHVNRKVELGIELGTLVWNVGISSKVLTPTSNPVALQVPAYKETQPLDRAGAYAGCVWRMTWEDAEI